MIGVAGEMALEGKRLAEINRLETVVCVRTMTKWAPARKRIDFPVDVPPGAPDGSGIPGVWPTGFKGPEQDRKAPLAEHQEPTFVQKYKGPAMAQAVCLQGESDRQWMLS